MKKNVILFIFINIITDIYLFGHVDICSLVIGQEYYCAADFTDQHIYY